MAAQFAFVKEPLDRPGILRLNLFSTELSQKRKTVAFETRSGSNLIVSFHSLLPLPATIIVGRSVGSPEGHSNCKSHLTIK